MPNHAPVAVVDALRAGLTALDLQVGDSATYPMHPSTLAWGHVTARPGRALCVEVRRDLLADPFEPFAQMRIGDANVTRLVEPFGQLGQGLLHLQIGRHHARSARLGTRTTPGF